MTEDKRNVMHPLTIKQTRQVYKCGTFKMITCKKCVSTQIGVQAWVNANTSEMIQGIEDNLTWCFGECNDETETVDTDDPESTYRYKVEHKGGAMTIDDIPLGDLSEGACREDIGWEGNELGEWAMDAAIGDTWEDDTRKYTRIS